MRRLFDLDKKDYDPQDPVFVRPSARALIIRDGRIAMVHSLMYHYYKFPGGGIEAGETPEEAMMRETAEEAGLQVIPASIVPYGLVHRVQRRAQGDTFVQDNYYFLCAVQDEPAKTNMDRYESEEQFTLEWIVPAQVIEENRTKDHGPWDPMMLERECLVLEHLMEEGYI